jgi:hypothetical protein
MDTREQSGHDDRLLLEYLLGAVPPGETERLDELSITDDEFAERLQAVEYDLIDAYVRGELTGQMLAQFQSLYLASPKTRERVQLARSFHRVAEETISLHGAAGISRGAPDSEKSGRIATRAGWRRVFTVPRPAWQWGLAVAAAVLVTVAGWMAVENRRLREQRDAALAYGRSVEQRNQQLEAQSARSSPVPEQQPQPAPGQSGSNGKPATEPPVILAFNLAPQMRGVSQVPNIVITADVDYITLQLELESADYAAWRARLRPGAQREPVWRSGRLSTYARDDRQIVAVSFPPRLLEAQLYIVELAGITASGSEELVASYPFRIIRK